MSDFETMYQEYIAGKTLKVLATENDTTPQAIHGAFKRRGWDTSKPIYGRARGSILQTIDDSELMAFKTHWSTLDSKVKGTIVESAIKSELAQQGFDVWQPYINNQKSDLGILCNGRFLRVQVKCAVYDANSKRFRCPLKTRDKDGQHIPYTTDDIDFFIVQCAGLQEFYVVPSEIGCNNTNMNMFPHRDRITTFSDGQVDWEVYRNAFHLLWEACQ